MAIVEEVQDEALRATSTAPRSEELSQELRSLCTFLTLPDHLRPSFLSEEKLTLRRRRLEAYSSARAALDIYRSRVLLNLNKIRDISLRDDWAALEERDRRDIFAVITRLYGTDDWTSSDICELIDDISTASPRTEMAQSLLGSVLRPLFTPHPLLSASTTRALPRPHGGPDALVDMHDDSSQTWKSREAWCVHNMLAWCCEQLDSTGIEENIGLILPPTLTMMDDWEPPWRGRGATVLSGWIDKLPLDTARRMGVYPLLIKSLSHTLSLYPVPPLPHVLPLTLRLIDNATAAEGGKRGAEEKRAEMLVDVMDKAVLSGWVYAPSGEKGRLVLQQVAKDLDLLCRTFGVGILRWMKTIVPYLLQPLIFAPTPAAMPHLESNLSALLTVLRTISPTRRVARWRGQILGTLCRLWVNIADREQEGAVFNDEGVSVDEAAEKVGIATEKVKTLVVEVFRELEAQCPSIREDEFAALLRIDAATFATLIPAKA